MQKKVLSDQELVGRYILGDRFSLECLIARHKQRVYSYIFLLVREQSVADDIFQDTFIKVVHTIKTKTYKEEGKFIQWVMRIAHNMVIDHFRRNKRSPLIENSDEYDIFDTISGSDENVEETLIKQQIHADLHQLIDSLPSEQREVLMLRHFSDMSFKEIADSTNVSINTALGRMRYAVINLRKMIQQKGVIMS